MRILRLEAAYSHYWQAIYRERPGLEQKSYAEQRATFDYDAFMYAGALKEDLKPLGHEVHEIFYNVPLLQKAWAKENGVPWPRGVWTEAVVLAQIRAWKPDVILWHSGRDFSREFLQQARAAFPAVRLMGVFIGSPFHEIDILKGFDFVLSCKQEFTERFRNAGLRAYYFQHVFDQRILPRLPPPPSQLIDEVVFSGNVRRQPGCHFEREQILERMADFPDMRIYAPQFDLRPAYDLADTALRRGTYHFMQGLCKLGVPAVTRRRVPIIGKAATWTTPPVSQLNPRLRPFLLPAVYGLKMFETLRNARVCLNIQADIAGDEAANIKMFEATGVGVCLLTDWKPNLGGFFELDREVVAYRSADECVEKARWLLDHPAECNAVGRAGQARALRDHTHTRRSGRLHELILQEIKR
ncbi:MAG: glycosyltransferase [Verrucomicrobiota bacterium]